MSIEDEQRHEEHINALKSIAGEIRSLNGHLKVNNLLNQRVALARQQQWQRFLVLLQQLKDSMPTKER